VNDIRLARRQEQTDSRKKEKSAESRVVHSQARPQDKQHQLKVQNSLEWLQQKSRGSSIKEQHPGQAWEWNVLLKGDAASFLTLLVLLT
jgi:hypothetical protein